jgi:hypothetical protein
VNPGPVDEAGKVAGGIVDSLKNQPLSLALVLMNCVLLLYLFYEAHNTTAARLDAVKSVLEMQREVQQLLARCVVPDQRRLELPPLPQERAWNE